MRKKIGRERKGDEGREGDGMMEKGKGLGRERKMKGRKVTER